MLIRLINKIIIFSCFFVFVNSAFSAQPECLAFKHKEKKLITLTSRLYHTTHIVLPEPLAANPIVGNESLWDVSGQIGTKHIFIQPNSDAAVGKSTTLIAISENNRTYNFLINRVDGHANYCIDIEPPHGAFGSTSSSYLSDADKKLLALKSQNISLQNNIKEVKNSVSSRVENAIKKYETQMYNNYVWKTFGRSKLTKGLVASVSDDGRFTTIRLTGIPYGVPTVYGYIEGKETLLDPDFDSAFNTYKIPGLFTKIKLKVSKKSGVVIRRNSINKTGYTFNSKGK